MDDDDLHTRLRELRNTQQTSIDEDLGAELVIGLGRDIEACRKEIARREM